ARTPPSARKTFFVGPALLAPTLLGAFFCSLKTCLSGMAAASSSIAVGSFILLRLWQVAIISPPGQLPDFLAIVQFPPTLLLPPDLHCSSTYRHCAEKRQVCCIRPINATNPRPWDRKIKNRPYICFVLYVTCTASYKDSQLQRQQVTKTAGYKG